MDKNLFDLSNQTAVVLGGNGTLGYAIAEGLAEHGARIAIIGRNSEKTYQAVKKLTDQGYIARGFLADLLDLSSVHRSVQEVKEWSSQWDILVNATGVNDQTPLFSITEEEWDRVMDVNLKGLFFSTLSWIKPNIDQKHPLSVIFISSVSSLRPLSRVLTYSVSKAGVNSLTMYLARELAPYNIRVNAIIPGFFPADQNRAILDQERLDNIYQHTPMKRLGTSDELKGISVWLASHKASSFVTGALIPVDGGFSAMTI